MSSLPPTKSFPEDHISAPSTPLFYEFLPSSSSSTMVDELTKQRNEVTAAKIANRLRFYTRKQLMKEHCWGVSTQLCLSNPWILKEMLTRSDLLNLSRLLLPSYLINNPEFPFLGDKFPHRVKCQGLNVTVYDSDTKTNHRFVLKQRGSSTSYVLIGKWREDFVKRRKLKDIWGQNRTVLGLSQVQVHLFCSQSQTGNLDSS